MLNTKLFILIAMPFLAGLLCLVLRVGILRKLVVIGAAVLLSAAAILTCSDAPFTATPTDMFGVSVPGLIVFADFVLLAVMFYFGYRFKRPLIMALSVFQFILLGVLEFAMIKPETHATFYCDQFSMIMILIISIIGSLICLHALPYMDHHEEHLGLSRSKQPRFFLVLVLFLGAMNGLVLANDLTFFYFFFELTTLCSFALIMHDETETALNNALHALLLNALGGAALLVGIVWLYTSQGTLDMQALITGGNLTGMLLFPVALLCFAGITKAAQMPFQSWLLGAMVAPTPTSALLHSSTMVKAGVYLVLRFSPAFEGTFLSLSVALVGAFTFIAAAALAIGQSNGKKVLAYSTVSNLGLIIACAGINTPAAHIAAILLIIFHAVSKGLLFLCVGTIEQSIGSRDIEDMRGLFVRMPLTTLITVLGVVTMILPPFGMLLGKWMAIESASGNIFLITMLAFGSGLTLLYWARWAGGLMSSEITDDVKIEKQSILMRAPLVLLCAGAILLSLGAPALYQEYVTLAVGEAPYSVFGGILRGPVGVFAVTPLFGAVALSLLFGVRALRRARNARYTAPYMAGIQTDDPRAYLGPMNQPVTVSTGNYYMKALFGEKKLTPWFNFAAGLLLLLMLGGSLS